MRRQLGTAPAILSTNSVSPSIGKAQPGQMHPVNPGTRGSDLAPGVYETWPYTSMVLVPGAHLDDKMILGRNALASTNAAAIPMPMVKPELHFKPRTKP